MNKFCFVLSLLITASFCSELHATADTLRVVRGGVLTKTASPIVTNLTAEGTLAVTGASTFSAGTTKSKVTLAVGATSINAALGDVFVTTANAGATAITAISNSAAGKVIYIIGGSSTNATTVADSGIFSLTGSFTANANDSLSLVCIDGTNWVEVGRADN